MSAPLVRASSAACSSRAVVQASIASSLTVFRSNDTRPSSRYCSRIAPRTWPSRTAAHDVVGWWERNQLGQSLDSIGRSASEQRKIRMSELVDIGPRYIGSMPDEGCPAPPLALLVIETTVGHDSTVGREIPL